ncbi:DUF4192 family protein [Amnibacterium endophyticum]|uniref:DUF4192 family protein n=1 Tax=Amnibacterium endophyticum TaxID=2109337 RepID=A0ABW4LGL3_9MICO
MSIPVAPPPANVVKCSTPADLLRLVPSLAGVPIEDSVVLVLWSGRRTHGAMRLDLPTTRVPDDQRAWARHVLGTVCRVEGADGVTPVVRTDASFAPSGRPPHADLLRALNREAQRMGLDVRDLLCVAADGWGSLLDPALPRGGRPLDEIAPREGDPAPPSPRRAPEYPETDEAAQDAFLDALERWWLHPEGPGGVLHGVDLRRPGSAFGRAAAPEPAMQRYRHGGDQADVVELVERMLDPHDGDGPCPCRALLFALATRQGLENLVLVQFGWGRALGAELWRDAHDGDPAAPSLASLGAAIGGGAFPRPDVARIARAIAALTEVGGLLDPEERAPVEGMLAWLHWAVGGGSIAGVLAERALALDPGRDVPSLVLARVQRGELPEWAFREDPTAPDPFAPPV